MLRCNVYIFAVKADKFAAKPLRYAVYDVRMRKSIIKLQLFMFFMVKYDLKYDILLVTMILEADK